PRPLGSATHPRPADTLAGERERRAEAAAVADPLGTERRPDVLLDELDRLLAGGGADAGVGVGERLALPIAPGHGSTRAGASRAASGDRTVSSSRASLVSASGTGTGYSPLRQAVQYDWALAPVAPTSRSSSRYASE